MLVVAIVSWHRVIVIVVDVCAGLVIVIQRQIRMIRLYSIVEDRDDDTFTSVTFLPRRPKIHVVAIFGSTVLQLHCSLILTVSFHDSSIRISPNVKKIPLKIKFSISKRNETF